MSDAQEGLNKLMGRLADGEPLVIGVVFVPGGPRVMMGTPSLVIHMAPSGARKLAMSFDTPEAASAGLTTAADLREAADQCEAMTAVIQ